MEKRLIFASIISVVLILAWGYFMPHAKKTSKQSQKPSTSVFKKQAPAVRNISTVKSTGISTGKNLQSKSKSKNIFEVSKSLENIKNVSYKGEKIFVRFNKSAGAISSLHLLNYSYTEQYPKNKVNLGNSNNLKRMIDFIPQNENAGTYIKLIRIIKNKNSIQFVYNIGNNIILTKEYNFFSGKYFFNNAVYIKNISNKPITFKGYFIISTAIKPRASKNADYINLLPIVYANKSLINPPIKNATSQYSGDISFAGFNSKYFLFSSLSPGTNISVRKTDKKISFIAPKKVIIAPGKIADISLKFYAGPKKLSLLTPLGHNLSSTLSFGFFGFFSIILLHVLEFFYGFVHNYGLAIILLVLGIRIVFYPLTYTGFKSMKRMQQLNPKIKELREKYKDNKTELNKKTMELYKESKVNPFGGCLPMLLQIPVFYGLYETLLVSIQLRNAPFIFWIHNLSAQDPYYILPILMGITMLISQKMNPVMGDPTQAKIMLILPIVFTFLFINFPAGLLLYWTVNNILTIAQQYIINRKFA